MISSLSKELVLSALRQVFDPEIGINIVDLGLIYDVEITADEEVHIAMTMTTPACPLHSYLSLAAEDAIRTSIPAVRSVTVDLVWEPPWQPAMMSPEAKRQLGGQN
jgi:metal-sulfur cluster biosynthetic enzyme